MAENTLPHVVEVRKLDDRSNTARLIQLEVRELARELAMLANYHGVHPDAVYEKCADYTAYAADELLALSEHLKSKLDPKPVVKPRTRRKPTEGK